MSLKHVLFLSPSASWCFSVCFITETGKHIRPAVTFDSKKSTYQVVASVLLNYSRITGKTHAVVEVRISWPEQAEII